MNNLEIDFCGVSFRNPTVLASGILGVTASSLRNVVRHGAGGVTTKSIWLEKHVGHKNPTMFGTPNYFLNAVGLSDAGIKKASEETFPEFLAEKASPILANIVAYSLSDFEKLTQEITKCDPDIIEVNISCPNVDNAYGKPFSCSAVDAAKVTEIVRANTKKPIVIKLTPNVPSIAEIAVACAEKGADGFTLINTVAGMAIDTSLRMPILTNKSGGVSGPAIKPVAVKAVYDVFRATGLPIIGTGGVMNGEDAIEMMMAGARLVGIGTMVYYRGVEGFGEIVKEMEQWCEREGVKSLEEIVGCANERIKELKN